MRSAFRRRLLGGIALLVAADPGTATAQTQPATPSNVGQTSPEVEEVVVTGLRSVDGSRIDIRKDAVATTDAITAAEIERTPDPSLAEVLDRVVGVSSDRGFNSSQARTVTIRGFDARYNSMDLDGNPVWNSSRNNRGTQLDVFPSSVVNQVLVYKTVTPDIDANSVGGHVSLRTLRAFDGGTRPFFKGRASIGFYEQDSLSGDGEPSYRIDGAGKFTFGPDNRYGFVAGFDLQRETFYDKYNQVTGYTQLNEADVPSGSLFSGLFDKTIERQALYAKVEARTTDAMYAFLSGAWFHMADVEDWWRGGLFLTPTQIASGGTLSGTFANATSEVYLEQYDLDRTTLSLGSGLDYRLGERGLLQLRGGYTNYDHDELLSRGERFQRSGLSGTYAIRREMIDAAITGGTLSEPATWRHRTGRNAFDLFIPHEDDIYSLNVDYGFNQHAEARGWGLRSGLSWRRLERRFDQTTNNYALPSGTVFTLADVSGQGAPSGGGPNIFDPASYWSYVRGRGVLAVDQAPTSDYDLTEDVTAVHGALVYATGRFRGLAGLRVERTRYENATADVQGKDSVPSRREFDYTEVLPNVQAQYSLTPGMVLRAAYTETLARPDFADFAFGQRVTLDVNGFPIVQGANPFLEPRTASNYELGVDFDFGSGFLSAALFQKDLDNETFTQRRETLNDAGVVVRTETLPLNTGDASVRGLEVDAVWRPLASHPSWLSGLELGGNYTHLDGDWNVVFTDGSRRSVDGLRNQPKWLANARLTWRGGPLEATLSWRARGRTFTGSFGTTAARDIWVDDYDRLDLQANYDLGHGLRVTAEVRNLNNAWWVEQTGLTNAMSVAVNPGRSLWIGVRVKR